jgi:hypothetical protein
MGDIHPDALAIIDTYFREGTRHMDTDRRERFRARAIKALADADVDTYAVAGAPEGWWCITCSDVAEEAHHGRRRDGLSECLFCDDIVIPVWKD